MTITDTNTRKSSLRNDPLFGKRRKTGEHAHRFLPAAITKQSESIEAMLSKTRNPFSIDFDQNSVRRSEKKRRKRPIRFLSQSAAPTSFPSPNQPNIDSQLRLNSTKPTSSFRTTEQEDDAIQNLAALLENTGFYKLPKFTSSPPKHLQKPKACRPKQSLSYQQIMQKRLPPSLDRKKNPGNTRNHDSFKPPISSPKHRSSMARHLPEGAFLEGRISPFNPCISRTGRKEPSPRLPKDSSSSSF